MRQLHNRKFGMRQQPHGLEQNPLIDHFFDSFLGNSARHLIETFGIYSQRETIVFNGTVIHEFPFQQFPKRMEWSACFQIARSTTRIQYALRF